MLLVPTARRSPRRPVSGRARAAIAYGLALAGAAALRAWLAALRNTPAETAETRRRGLCGAYTQAGPYTIFARVPARPLPETAALPPVVLVHGFVFASRSMEPLAGALGRHGLCVLAPDLPGFGESAKPPRPLGLPELADALALWLRARGIPRAMLVGTSFGCQVLVELALRHSALVDRLVLHGPGTDPAARTLSAQVRNNAIDWWREPRPVWPAIRVDYAKAGLRRATATARLAMRDRVEDKLPLVRAPALVLHGSRDVVASRAWAERVAHLLPRARLAMVEGGAHLMCYTAPEAFAAAILPFLREAAAAPVAEAAQ
jgi:pimeloyl-ACP methyl ester carboxylesterase